MTMLPWLTAAALLTLALLHAYWALGWTWPARDSQSLALAVVGGTAGARMPGAMACFNVAVLFGAAALLVLAATGSICVTLPMGLIRGGAHCVMVALGLRAAAGLFAERIRPSGSNSRFARLNLLIYSPLALTLSVMVFFALRHH
jgi:hypothetical protein